MNNQIPQNNIKRQQTSQNNFTYQQTPPQATNYNRIPPNMKVCKYCKSQIDKRATVCPFCRRKLKNDMKWLLIPIGVIFLFAIIGSLGDENDETSTSETQLETEATTEEEEATEETTEISKEDFEKEAQEVTYEDIYRNPETYKDKPIKVTVYIDEYDTQFLGLVDVYYGTIDGKNVFLTDDRSVKEPTIAKGDTVVVYAICAGLATLTESQKNILGVTTSSEKSQIPSMNIKYVEIQ